MQDSIDLKNKAISGIIWKFLERISAQLITFVVSIILARIIAPEDYGIIALVTIFITLANVFVVNGLGTSLVQKKNVDNKDFSTMFYASIVLSLIIDITGEPLCPSLVLASTKNPGTSRYSFSL